MAERVNIGGFIASFITFCFVFSTLFTLAFYYYQGANTAYGATAIPAEHAVSGFPGLLSQILDLISWLSPFALIKAFIMYTMAATPDLYQIVDMLLLRPIGWIVVFLEVNWLISKIPTISGE